MRAAKYFPKNSLSSLEDVLFADSDTTNKIKYCLIHETRKVYYIGTSTNIAGLVSRLRSSVLKAENILLAHHLQENAKTTNMSDWVIALFSEELDDHEITKHLQGFERLEKASRYEVHPVEDAKLYLLEHKRYGAQVYISSSRELTASLANSRAKAALSRRTINYTYDLDRMPSALKSVYIRVFHAAEHSSTGDWNIKEIPMLEHKGKAISRYVAELNERFLDLTFRV